MNKLVVAAIIGLSLAGCDKTVKTESEYRHYKIMEIKRPKHFRVVLKDMETGVERRVNVSKHCNRWREVQLYEETALMTTTYTRQSGDKYVSINARPICPH